MICTPVPQYCPGDKIAKNEIGGVACFGGET
jgi:hypothetical protein